MQKIEVINETVSVLNEDSKQNWISIKDFIPTVFGTKNQKGDMYGRYLCIVERKYKKTKNSLQPSYKHPKMVNITCEMCYWNKLANKFQDSKNKWVKVTHWCPVPKRPRHEIVIISREEMLLKIKNKEFFIIKQEQEFKNDIIGMYEFCKNMEIFGVSLDEVIYSSVMKDDNNMEDFMLCIKK